jgi:Flp pilus assembly protein CpaB
MSSPKKSKKVLLQFAIALVIAVILGLGAIVVGVTLIKSISTRAATTQKEATKKADDLQAELESMRRREEAKRNEGLALQIVQTQIDLSPGTVITDDMLALVQSRDSSQQAALKNPAQIVGKMVKAFTPKGSFLKAADLMDSDAWLVVTPDKRAITIRVDGNGTISGSLVSGARVDILGTIIPAQGTPFTKTLLQNALVMRVENAMSSKGAASAITLLVTPKEAEALSLVGQIGFFHITLRDNQDASLLTGRMGISATGLYNKLDDPATPAAAKTPATRIAHSPAPARHRRSTDDNIHNANFSPNAALPNPGEGGPIGGRNRFSMKVIRGSGSEVVEFQR